MPTQEGTTMHIIVDLIIHIIIIQEMLSVLVLFVNYCQFSIEQSPTSMLIHIVFIMTLFVANTVPSVSQTPLTHWDRDKMVADDIFK